MKRVSTLIVCILSILAGCDETVDEKQELDEIDPKELPDTVALQDDFTREFIVSPEEVEEVYYLFESKTGGYTMWYPKNAKLSQTYYQKKKDYFEALHVGGYNDQTTGDSFYIRATYGDSKDTKDTDIYLYLLSSSIHYDGEYEKVETDDKIIYFATMKNITNNKTKKQKG